MDAQLLAHQRPGRGLLVVRVDLVQRLAGDLVGDALAAQLLGQRPRARPLLPVPVGDPEPGERLVVDQPDLLEPVEQRGRHLVGDVLGGQPVGELLAAAGLAGQLVEQDLARDRLGVGVGPEIALSSSAVSASAVPPVEARSSRLDRRLATSRSRSFEPQKASTPMGSSERSLGVLVDLRADAELLEDLLLQLVGQVGVVA